MYIIDARHFLNDKGDIGPERGPGRKMADFAAAVGAHESDGDRPDTRAYGHAARYWAWLREIAATGIGLHPLESHEHFEAAIRSGHARKVAFWAYVNGKRRDRVDEDEHDGDELLCRRLPAQ